MSTIDAPGPSELEYSFVRWGEYLLFRPATNIGHSTNKRGRGAIVKTINILEFYQVLMSETISKCEVCGQEFGTPGELDEHKRAKHQG